MDPNTPHTLPPPPLPSPTLETHNYTCQAEIVMDPKG